MSKIKRAMIKSVLSKFLCPLTYGSSSVFPYTEQYSFIRKKQQRFFNSKHGSNSGNSTAFARTAPTERTIRFFVTAGRRQCARARVTRIGGGGDHYIVARIKISYGTMADVYIYINTVDRGGAIIGFRSARNTDFGHIISV